MQCKGNKFRISDFYTPRDLHTWMLETISSRGSERDDKRYDEVRTEVKIVYSSECTNGMAGCARQEVSVVCLSQRASESRCNKNAASSSVINRVCSAESYTVGVIFVCINSPALK